MKITEIPNTPWRDSLSPASYRGAYFHVEAGSRENGRRIVLHQFPKKELPYAEDMGRQAYEFNVRGYCIAYPHDLEGGGLELYRRDYRIARDLLVEQLEREGYGKLQLPLLAPVSVVVQKYRLTEDQKLGGYCTFDMQFVEFGRSANEQVIDSRSQVIDKASAANDRTGAVMDGQGNKPAANVEIGPIEIVP
jgi:prophage DNA circulation protein